MVKTLPNLSESNRQISQQEDTLTIAIQVVFVLATFVTLALLAALSQFLPL